jgi:glycosyltransferase involved in cell wall biosynthesis
MRIGLIAPPWIPIPPPAYGGIERVVALQAAGMAAAGHQVTLIAAPGSAVAGVDVVVPLQRLPTQIGMATDEWRHVLGGLDQLNVDMIFDHSGPLGALLSAQGPIPAIHVVHGSLETELLGLYEGVLAHAPRLRLAAISHSQRRAAPHLPFVGVCHNAIDLTETVFQRRSRNYLAFLGRMAPEKGVEDAIRLAQGAGLPLLIAAKCREPAEQEYFDKAVAPHLGPEIRYLGELDRAATYEFLSHAAALLFPIRWREPFGMVMIEAMACGTPVLATDRGAVEEIVLDGVTGFVRDTATELAPLIGRIHELDRAACRAHVAEHFATAALVRGYTQLLTPARGQPLAPVGSAPPIPLAVPARQRPENLSLQQPGHAARARSRNGNVGN